jgi:hypothetical protein
MMTVKLSDKPCLLCGKTVTNVLAKSKEQDFQGVVCPEHMIALLKKWEETKRPEPAAK